MDPGAQGRFRVSAAKLQAGRQRTSNALRHLVVELELGALDGSAPESGDAAPSETVVEPLAGNPPLFILRPRTFGCVGPERRSFG